jgi:putative oligomerization/nucleic acid binding protein
VHQLTQRGQQIVDELAKRYGVSGGAVITLLQGLVASGGTMAQFSHPELGGMGQWTRGGMTMVGDMFNNALKAKVDGLCAELSDLLAQEPVLARAGGQSQSQRQGGGGNAFGEVSLFVPSGGENHGGWWPAELGAPSSTGSQDNLRYAYFPEARRLAVDIAGKVTVYDTLDHQIGGVSQQQGSDASFTFASQRGTVRLSDLPVTFETRAHSSSSPTSSAPAAASVARRHEEPVPKPAPAPEPKHAAKGVATADDIFAKIERLADLRGKGILSEEEFAEKKTELLSRL